MSATYRLAIEELAYLLGFLGDANMAAGFLRTITGDLHPDNLAGRLTAASHSLLARGLIKLGAEGERPTLVEELRAMVNVLMGSAISIRYQLARAQEEQTTTYFVMEGDGVSNEVTEGVVTELRHYRSLELVTDAMLAPLPHTELAHDAEALGAISGEVLQQVRRSLRSSPISSLIALLDDLPRPVAEALLHDMTADDVTWVSVLRMEVAGGELESERGLFLAQHPTALWLFETDADNSALVQVYRADQSLVRQKLQSLVIGAALPA